MSCSLKLRNISAKIGERVLFEGLNLDVLHKEKIVIIGENGCGKSTLLEIIGGLKEPANGEIELFHHKIQKICEFEKFRNYIGYLFQNSNEQFINPTVFDDVAFGLFAQNETIKCGKNAEFDEHLLKDHDFCAPQILSQEQIYEKTEKILQELNIFHLKDKIVFHLSGGEKKLVALAGVLVCEPKIILLDEPTTALDFNMQNRLSSILENLKISQIIVSHDEKFISNVADKIYYLSQNGLMDR